MRLPEKFDERGMLPPGDYELTLEALLSSILVDGPDPKPIYWDTHWRLAAFRQSRDFQPKGIIKIIPERRWK